MRRMGILAASLLVAGAALVSAPPARAGAGKPIAGYWTLVSPQAEIKLRLLPDGRFERTYRLPGDAGTDRGTYRLVPGKLVLAPDGGKSEAYGVRWIDANTLEATDADGTKFPLRRQKSPERPKTPEPPEWTGQVPLKRQPQVPIRQVKLPLPFPKHPAGHILYSRIFVVPLDTGKGKIDIPLSKLFVMNGDGTGKRPFFAPVNEAQAGGAWWSPDYKTILFCSDYRSWDSSFFSDIFLVRADGTGLRRVTGGDVELPEPKATGTIVASVVDDTGQKQHIRDIGPVPRSVRTAGGRCWVAWQGHRGKFQENAGGGGFVISGVPAGSRWVRVWRDKHAGARKIVEVPPNGQVTVTLTLTGGNDLVSHPCITPDGRYIVAMSQHAYFVNVPRQPPDPKAPWKAAQHEPRKGIDTIGVFDARTGTPVARVPTLTLAAMPVREPRLSPDGKWIAFGGFEPGKEDILVVSLESVLRNAAAPRRLIEGERHLDEGYQIGNVNPVWSPDGRRLAFVRYVASAQGLTGNIHVANADGTGLRQVSRVEANQLAANPSWSPDGRRIAYGVLTSRGRAMSALDWMMKNFRGDIWVADADGANPTRLTSDGLSGEPAWGQ